MARMANGCEVTYKVNTKEVVKAIEDASTKKMAEAVNEVRNTTLNTLSGSRTGITYRVPGTRKTYTASAPGEPPAQATARLRQSIKVAVEGEGRKIVGIVGTELEYGKCLEFGTRKMAARPWLKPSFEKSAEKIMAIFGKRWFT